MTREQFTGEHHRWALGIVLALLLQAVAFSYWAGALSERVTQVTKSVDTLTSLVTAHINSGR